MQKILLHFYKTSRAHTWCSAVGTRPQPAPPLQIKEELKIIRSYLKFFWTVGDIIGVTPYFIPPMGMASTNETFSIEQLNST